MAKKASVEEKVEELYKGILDSLGIRRYGKTEDMNPIVARALRETVSKSGNDGGNRPDVQFMLDDGYGRNVPVMVEAKGGKNKLEKRDATGEIVGVTRYTNDGRNHKRGDPNYSSVSGYAVNGALHYGKAVLDRSDGEYDEVVIVGVNGTTLDSTGNVADPECMAYYVSEKNGRIPKPIPKVTADDWSLFKPSNSKALFEILNGLNLTEEERKALTDKTEATFERKIQAIHQSIFDDERLKQELNTNDKLYLLCGLIMAGLKTKGVKSLDMSDLNGNDNEYANDGVVILGRIRAFLRSKNLSQNDVELVMGMLERVFRNEVLWKPEAGVSMLKPMYGRVKTEIIPCFESNLHFDFTGKLLNLLSGWVDIENNEKGDVQITPRYLTKLMARLGRVNMNSYVWDVAMGTAGFLVSASDEMMKDARAKIADVEELEKKLKSIRKRQLLGIEILESMYMLALLNMILMDETSPNVMRGNSRGFRLPKDFPADLFLLNPPYSAPGKGLVFVEEALSQMTTGYGVVLIQDSAGNGQGTPFTKRILERNTLKASIKMPSGLFGSKASVSVYIFVFEIGRPHEKDDLVTFVDFSEDGYARKNRKKSTQEVNLKDVDHATERYAELEAIVLGKKPKTSYYTEANGKVIRDSISMNGDDWTFNQHKKIDTTPTEEDFKKTVADYLAWKVSAILKEQVSADV